MFSTPLFHPTVMARAEVLKNNLFSENIHNSEDYELWSRLLFQTSVQLANLPQALLKYRVFAESFTQRLNKAKRLASAQNSINNLKYYIYLSDKEEDLIKCMIQEERLSWKGLLQIKALYLKASEAFKLKENLAQAPKVTTPFFKYFLKQYLR